MQTYDVLMLLVLVCATIFGFWKGMAWQLASLASLVVSYIVALKFSERLAPTFGSTAPWNRFVAMLVIYAVTSFMIWTAFRLVSGMIDKVKLEAFDKQLGAIFGFAKGVLLCVAVTFFAVTLLPPAQGEMIVGSQSGQYIVAFLNKADAVVPPELHEVIDPYLHKVQERLNGGQQASFPHATEAESSSSGWSLPNWGMPSWLKSAPAAPQIDWPQSQAPSTTQPLSWPAQTQSTVPANIGPANLGPANAGPANSTFNSPREPNPFPDPYSAARPQGAAY